jgi:uncharacterized membrane protein YphA (DoxX/SURF4 family)
MRLRFGLVTLAGLLFLAGALGLIGAWALPTAVVLLVGTSVVTVIVWEERDTERGELVPARIDR